MGLYFYENISVYSANAK